MPGCIVYSTASYDLSQLAQADFALFLHEKNRKQDDMLVSQRAI